MNVESINISSNQFQEMAKEIVNNIHKHCERIAELVTADQEESIKALESLFHIRNEVICFKDNLEYGQKIIGAK
jgi:hypothetical protein